MTWRDTKRFTAEDIARIERERVEMGEAWFSQEYEGAFVQTSGQLISEDHIMAASVEGIVMDDMSDIRW